MFINQVVDNPHAKKDGCKPCTKEVQKEEAIMSCRTSRKHQVVGLYPIHPTYTNLHVMLVSVLFWFGMKLAVYRNRMIVDLTVIFPTKARHDSEELPVIFGGYLRIE